jgi:predicted phosphate transport protein (TIGR00153 family)
LFLRGHQSDKKFFNLLQRSTHTILRATEVFRSLAANMKDCHCLAAELKDLESEGDNTAHEIFNLLDRVFMTPFEREDIYSLTTHLDNILDGIEKVAARISLYNLTEHDPIIVDFAAVLHQQALALQSGMDKLCGKRWREIKADVVRINELENRGDQLLREGLRSIFAHPSDVVRLIQLKEVYEILEDATDRSEDVADVMESVVMRNA